MSGFLQPTSTLGSSDITDGSITNTDIATNAAIDVSKLASGTDGYLLESVSGVSTWVPNPRKLAKNFSQATAQTVSIGSTNLSPSNLTAGMYRVSVYALCTTAGGGTLDVTVTYTDAAAARTVNIITGLDVSATNASEKSIVLKCNGSSNVSYSTTLTVTSGSPAYSVDVAIERIL